MARILSDDLPRPRVPILTYSVMAAWAVMWVVQALRPDDGNVGDSSQALACRWGMVPVHVTGGAGTSADPCVALSTEHSPWLEVLTAQFLHASWWHVLGNLLFLWVFGPSLEERLGRVLFLPFVLGIGYAGFLVEAVADASSAQPVIGGSGVVAAVLGAYLVLFPGARLRLVSRDGWGGGMPAWIPIAIWIAYETIAAVSGAQPDTAHWVHVAAFAMAALLARPAAAGRGTMAAAGAAPAEPPVTTKWVRVAIARNQPEAEMIQGLLADAGIPAYVRRMAGFDVPEYLAGGPRDILVPAEHAGEAHAMLEPPDD